MCGRIVQATSPEEIAREFGAAVDAALAEGWRPRWNVAPSSQVAVVAPTPEGRRVELGIWGLVPPWQPARTAGLFNARAETVATLPSFRDAYRRGRLIVPADAFYEWENPDYLAERGRPLGRRAPRQPWAYLPARGRLFAFGGIAAPRDGVPGLSLITTPANGVVGEIHDRMPVLLPGPAEQAAWLDPDTHPDDLAALLAPVPDALLVARRVSRRVSNARNEGPSCLEEAGVEGLGLV